MSHQPAHLRRAFLDWIDADCPHEPWIEEHYQRRTAPSIELAKRFVSPQPCTDVLPKDHASRVAFLLGLGDDRSIEAAGMTYATAAGALLLAAHGEFESAQEYLKRTHGKRRLGPDLDEWWSDLDHKTRDRFLAASLYPAELPDDLAHTMVGAGMLVVWAAFEGHPWRPMWPSHVLAFVSRRRLEITEAANRGR